MKYSQPSLRILFHLVLLGTLLPAVSARATKCPNVMFVLDRSGSMGGDPNGGVSSPSKWQLLQNAVKQVVTQYGNQLPFGMEMFTSSGGSDSSCFQDTMISVEPDHNTAQSIIGAILGAMPDSGTNTAQAIRRAAQDPKMHDPSRGQYIILITDGDPNCPFDDSTNASYTVAEIAKAATSNPSIHTFVIGFDGSGGVNPSNLNRMAKAGKEPQANCTGSPTSPCYYSASNAQKFSAALMKIVNVVAGGEFGMGMCDDSCVSNGCPKGQVCSTDEQHIMPHCVNDPCAGVVNCPAGDYCRTGQCVHACLVQCQMGQKCVDGNCVSDPCYQKDCGTLVCDSNSGGCVPNACTNKTCPAGTTCDPATGICTQNACNLVTCPMGTTCVAGGNCESSTPSTTMMNGGGRGRASVGCSIGRGPDAVGAALCLLVVLAMAFVERRRRR